jgi:hypothetical protein
MPLLGDGLPGERESESARSSAAPRAAVHARECGRRGGRESLDHLPGILRVRKVVHLPAESFARPEDIRLRDGRVVSTALRISFPRQYWPATFELTVV